MISNKIVIEDLADYAIKGELLTANIIVSETEYALFKNDTDFIINLKKRLAIMLTEALLNEDKFVEFVRQRDPTSFTQRFYARMAVVPKDKVQLIRQFKKS
jgi:hypothetical protein